MRKALLLYNPLSGTRRRHRSKSVAQILEVLQAAGVDATAAPTLSEAGIANQVRQAVVEGYDAVLAGGGDGTVHHVIQGLVKSNVALGVIPLGTANSLAHDLRIPFSPRAAARALLTSEPRRFAVGQITFHDFAGDSNSRFFTVAAGAGMDAHLFHGLSPLLKDRLGMAAYCGRAARLWLTHQKHDFHVTLGSQAAKPAVRMEDVSQLLAVRIKNFGGVLRELAPGASLDRDDVRLILFRTHSRVAYLRYVLCGMAGMQPSIKGVELLHATEIDCAPLLRSGLPVPILVEADGEVLGTLPARITMVPDALTILTPER